MPIAIPTKVHARLRITSPAASHPCHPNRFHLRAPDARATSAARTPTSSPNAPSRPPAICVGNSDTDMASDKGLHVE